MKELLLLSTLTVYGCGLMDQSIEKRDYKQTSDDQNQGSTVEGISSEEATDFALWSFGNMDPSGFLEKFDADEDGKLSEEEKAAAKEAVLIECDTDEDDKLSGEERHACSIKKFDKDGDGKLNKEERSEFQAARKKTMQERWEALKEMLKSVIKNGKDKPKGEKKKLDPEKKAEMAKAKESFCAKLKKSIEERENAPLLKLIFKKSCETIAEDEKIEEVKEEEPKE